MAVDDLAVYRVESAFDVRRHALVIQMGHPGRAQVCAQRFRSRPFARFVAEAPATLFARGHVIVDIQQFRRRQGAPPISFDKLFGEMFVHYTARLSLGVVLTGEDAVSGLILPPPKTICPSQSLSSFAPDVRARICAD